MSMTALRAVGALLVSCWLTQLCLAQDPPATTVPSAITRRPRASFARMPTVFVENRGQLDDRLLFSARHRGMDAYFTSQSFVLQLVQRDAREPEAAIAASLALEFEGAAGEPVVEGLEPLPGRYNYFLGDD